jgi:hypothetical protein
MADDREQREQIVWQLRAAQVYADLLREQIKTDLLPVLRWTVESAGCALTASPAAQSDGGKRDAVRAWSEPLDLPVEETDMGSGMARVQVHGRFRQVLVTVAATLYGEEEIAP